MTNTYPHIIEKIEDWPINQFSEARPEFIQDLNAYTYDRILETHGDNLESLVSKVIYQEKQRIKLNPWKVDPADEKLYWQKLESIAKKAMLSEDADEQYEQLLKRIINRYSEEIVGNFNPKTFRFARKFLTSLFKRIYLKSFTRKLRIWGTKEDLLNKIHLSGEVEKLRSLYMKGTVVLVPMHFSNLDSILLGYMLDMKAGIPASAFGAGLNLFNVELAAYYINRLGAYKVDRRKKNPIYLENLKSYTSLSLVKGAPNIFFPGGTRSRSGHMEENLKFGLLGSVIDGQRYCIKNGINKKIYIVPIVLGYHFTLEAAGLINQHLKSVGREKYSSAKSKRGKIASALKFVWRLTRKESEVFLNVGEPMDVIGNLVDKDGNSLDNVGNKLEIKEFFEHQGESNKDLQREAVYTRLLADKITEAFKKENVVLSSHLAAYTAFKLLEKHYKEMDLFGILKQPVSDFSIPKADFIETMDTIIVKLRQMESLGMLKLAPIFKSTNEEIFEDGVYNVGVFHLNKVLRVEKEVVTSDDFRLLHYYHNRLDAYGLEKELA